MAELARLEFDDDQLEELLRSVERVGTGRTAEVVIPRTVLETLYVTRKMSAGRIALLVGTTKKTVRLKLIRFGINRRPLKEAFRISPTHAQQCRKGGPDHPSWKGGRKMNQGYVMLYRPGHPEAAKYGGYVFEHRLVMEQMIGRPLLIGEEVHHKNEVRNDNHPGNLELLTKSEHMTHHAAKRHQHGDPTFGFKKGAKS